MALTTGSSVGPYEILSSLGSGGMGEVYRARDARLNRDVAIKVLLPAVADDPERLARFTREAQVLAALNHPHIAHIYGLEEGHGAHALVMELVEGPTLADRIAAGPIPLNDALAIAIQIAEALEAAHEQGIVHRDLKPANIKVRADGTVKVLDFGLAKAMDPAGVGAGIGAGSHALRSLSPTITSPAMTSAGVIMGTAAYMSPEQARGGVVDKRADLWAFGVVLYEMLGGTCLFDGPTVSDTLAHVLTREPDWSILPPATPPVLRTLLRRCLEKDRRKRLADAADARLDLEDARTAPPLTTATAVSDAGTAPGRATRVAWFVAGVAVLVTLALVPFALRRLFESPPAAREMRLDIVSPATDDPMSFAVSPDGSQIAFVAAREGGVSQLWLRPVNADTARPLPGTEGAAFPFWSPDGRSIAYFAAAKLLRLDLVGGAPRVLAPVTSSGRGGSWNADGVILYSSTATAPLSRLPASGGPATPVTKLDSGQVSHRWPMFLPDGRHFLYFVQGSAAKAGIYLGSLDAPETTRLVESESAGAYRDGLLMWARGSVLVAQHLDIEGRRLIGDIAAVADGVAVDPGISRTALSVAATGEVVYRKGIFNRRQLVWRDRSGKVLGELGSPDEDGLTPRLSPDGTRAVVGRSILGNADLWIVDPSRITRFTFDASLDRFPVWVAGTNRIVFDSTRSGPRNLYVKSVDSVVAEVPLVTSSESKVASDVSRDGRFLIYFVYDLANGRDLWIRPLTGDQKPWPFVTGPFEERWGAFSPDGRFVAYESNESGQDEIYIRAFVPPASDGQPVATGGQWQVSTTGGVFPRWAADGHELYYVDSGGRMMAAPITITPTGLNPGPPIPLFPMHITGGGVDGAQGYQYDVTRDGRFLINTVLETGSAPLTFLMNWQPPAHK